MVYMLSSESDVCIRQILTSNGRQILPAKIGLCTEIVNTMDCSVKIPRESNGQT